MLSRDQELFYVLRVQDRDLGHQISRQNTKWNEIMDKMNLSALESRDHITVITANSSICLVVSRFNHAMNCARWSSAYGSQTTTLLNHTDKQKSRILSISPMSFTGRLSARTIESMTQQHKSTALRNWLWPFEHLVLKTAPTSNKIKQFLAYHF